MKIILIRLLTITFLGLAIIHFYWAFGGQWGFENALPTNVQGIRVANSTKIDSIIVGLMLLLFGVFYLFFIDRFKAKLTNWIKKIAMWGIPIIFILRAVGDFKYIGFFKQAEFKSLMQLSD